LADRPVELTVVTAGACDVQGGEQVDPAQAAVGAAALLPGQEIPTLHSRGIDLPRGDAAALAPLLAAEVAAPPEASVVALRGGRRWLRSFRPWRPGPSAGSSWRRNGVYVLVGGLGFFGRTVARHLLGQLGAHVVLVDVRAVPPRPEWAGSADETLASLAEMDGLGGTLEVVTADASDADALREALLGAARAQGRIDAILFAAGPTAGEGIAAFQEMTPQSMLPHLASRVAGLRALAAATRDVPVGSCLVVSSLSTVLGGLGSGPYMATSAWTEAFAAARRADGWRTIAWEHWRRPGEVSLGGRRDRYAIDPTELAQTVEVALQTPVDELMVSTAPLQARLEEALRRPSEAAPLVTQEAQPTPSGAGHSRPEVSTPYVAPRTEDERRVTDLMRQLLGIDQVGVLDNFFDLGGDSLMAMQLISHLRDQYRCAVPMSDLFADPTAAALAARHAQESGSGTPAAGAPPTAPAAVAPASPPTSTDADIEEILASESLEKVSLLLAEVEREASA
jgi:acyl carrier protein/NADP-dependent 3-hydroxy acid dehydrogenase YdfG